MTFYRSVDDLPPFDDYRMAGRTYRYFDGAVLYPFGHGLSYTQFEYSDLQLPQRVHAGRAVEVAVTVRNAGERDGWEVVQLYLSDPETSAPVPRCSLQGFRRIFLHAGESHRLYFDLHARQLSLIAADGERVVEPGSFEVSVGGGQPGVPGVASVNGRFEVTGELWTTPQR